ncbi:MAG: hypothetical protein O2964_19295, partial [Verrucomicrobia bacterium]|nr:hypothetical protein [Verrucomicrobiota bacterium]
KKTQGPWSPHIRIADARGRIEIPTCRDTTCGYHKVERAVPGACLVACIFKTPVQWKTQGQWKTRPRIEIHAVVFPSE